MLVGREERAKLMSMDEDRVMKKDKNITAVQVTLGFIYPPGVVSPGRHSETR